MDFGGGGNESFSEQQLSIRRRITESKAVDQLDVLFLLDDSGSISDKEFVTMGHVCERICLELTTKNSRFGAITFHSSCTMISEFNSDKATVLKSINSYTRTRGSTNLKEGLEKAIKLFEAARARTNAKRICFIITDGAADSDPSELAVRLKLLNVTNYCIGVGNNVGMDGLQKVSSYGCSVLVHDMDQIISLFNAPATSDSVIRDLHVTLEATITKSPVKFQEPFQLRIAVRSIGPKTIPAGAFFAFFGGDYFHTTSHRLPFELISGSPEYSFEVTMRSTGKSFTSIPNAITFSITHPQGGVIFCDHNEICLHSEYFIGSFLGFKPTNTEVKALNILLFGIIGSGKSSFLNSILTAFSSQVTDPALVGGNDAHVTRVYRRFEMGRQVLTLPQLPINLWDTWGLDGETYSGHFLLKLLEGNVPSDFQMENVNIDGTVSSVDTTDESPNARRIHGVLLFVPIGILEEEVLTARVHEVLKEMNTKSLQTMLIVTRADTIDPSSRFAHQHAIARKFNVPDYKVCLVTNYTKSKDKDFAIDKVTLRIFAEMTQIADTYAKTYISACPSPPRQTSTTQRGESLEPRLSPQKELPPASPGRVSVTESDVKQLTSITIDFGGKKAELNVNESTTFESLLASASQKAKVIASDYCLASLMEGGVEYGLKDLVRAALPAGEAQIYMRKDEGFA